MPQRKGGGRANWLVTRTGSPNGPYSKRAETACALDTLGRRWPGTAWALPAALAGASAVLGGWLVFLG